MIQQSRFAILLLSLAILGCGGSDDSEPKICGENYLSAEQEAALRAADSHEFLNICMENRSGDVIVESHRVKWLTIEGTSPTTTLSFPSLAGVEHLYVYGCNFKSLSFPALASLDSVFLACGSSVNTSSFELGLGGLAASSSMIFSGDISVSAPGLTEIEELELGERRLGNFVTAPEARVNRLFVNADTDLGKLRLPNLSNVGSLEILSTQGDLARDGFESLRLLGRLEASNAKGLSQCAIDRLVARLDSPPELVRVDESVSSAGCP